MGLLVEYLFGAASFVPHGYCLLWRPDLVAMHAISDAAIAFAYLSIPVAIGVFLHRRRDLEHRGLAALFAAFVFACGLTHLVGLVTLWVPVYGLLGLVKAITAVLSVVTAALLWPLIPKLVALPSPKALATANGALQQRIAEADAARAELEAHKAELERRVAERTAELVAANRTLAEAESYWRALYRYAPALMVSVGKDGRIVEANDCWLGRLGYTRGEMIDRAVVDFVHPEDRAAVAEVHAATLRESGKLEGVRISFLHRDGSAVETEVSALMHRGGPNRPDAAFLVASDLTRSAAAERALRENAEKLARANDDLQQFAYVASHDLQEPLRKIGTFSDFLATALAEGKREDADYALGVLVRSARRARRLVEDLLAYSRAAKRPMEPGPVDLSAVVGDVLSAVAGTVSESRAAVAVRVGSELVTADRTQLFRLLLNLVSNALKYHAPGKEPFVEIASSHAADGSLRISVRDEGIGFDAKDAEAIFQPFKRLETAPGDVPGSGIGLAVCRKIAERHGWTIQVESATGHGATFTVIVPPTASAAVTGGDAVPA